MWRFVRYAGISVVVLLGAVGICGGAFYLLAHRYDPPSNWSNPPIYSGAQGVRVLDYGENGEYQSDGYFLSKVITFTVADQPQKVRAFYRQAFGNIHWRPDTGGGRPVPTTGPTSELLSAYASNGSMKAVSIYYVDVISDPSGSGGTNVEIRIGFSPGY